MGGERGFKIFSDKRTSCRQDVTKILYTSTSSGHEPELTKGQKTPSAGKGYPKCFTDNKTTLWKIPNKAA